MAKLIDNKVLFFDDADIAIADEFVASAKRLMKDQVRALIDNNIAVRNEAYKAMLRLHLDIPATTGTVAPNSGGKPREGNFSDRATYLQVLMTWRAEQANIGPDYSAIEDAVLAGLGALAWPFETNITVSLDNQRLLLDVDLPEIEGLADNQWAPDYTGLAIVTKNLTRRARNADYVDHVASVVVRLLGYSFATSLLIQRVAISAYTQRSTTTGQIENDYVAAVEVDRPSWSDVDLTQLANIDPNNLLRRMGAKFETDARGLLLVQQPIS